MDMYIYEFIMNEGYEGINPIQFGEQQCEPLHNFGPALRPLWILHYVVSGCGKIRIHGKTWYPKPGDVFVIPPYVESYYEADETNPWHYIWIGFEINHLNLSIDQVVISNPQLGMIFQSMRHCREMDNGKSPYLCGRIWEMFSVLIDENKQNEADYISKSVNWIESNYMRSIRIKEIADSLHLDRSYFTSIFKEKMGLSPQQYITNLRMKKAVELMVKYNTTPTTTALSLGYSDVFSFSKAFKQYYGISPRGYITEMFKS